MPKFFLILCLLISCLGFTTASHTDSIRVTLCSIVSVDWCGEQPTLTKTIEHFDSVGNIVEVNSFYFSPCDVPQHTGWRHGSDNYYYYDAEGHVIQQVDSNYHYYPYTWTSYRQTVSAFDSSGNKTLETVSGGNVAQPQNYFQYSFGFDSLNKKTYEMDEHWDTNNAQWDTVRHKIWLYDSFGRMESNTTDSWGPPTFVYMGFTKEKCTYDSMSNLIQSERMHFSSPAYYDSSKTVFYYDTLNLMRTAFEKSWDTITSTWQNNSRATFEYDSLNRMIVRYNFYCADSTCIDTLRRLVYTYDATGHLIQTQSADYDAGFWQNTGSNWTYYDTAGNVVDEGSSSINFCGCDPYYWITYTYNSENHLTYSHSDQGSCNYTLGDCYYYNLNQDSMIVMVNSPVTVCPFDTVYFAVTVAGGVPPYTYQWTPLIGLIDPNVESPGILADSTITYTLTVTDSIGNSVSSFSTLNVFPQQIHPVTIASIGSPCIGEEFYLFFNSDSLVQPWSAVWRLNGQALGFATTDTIPIINTGVYTVTLNDLSYGCVLESDSFSVTLFPHPEAIISATGSNEVCLGDSVELTSAYFPSLIWNTGDTTEVINVSSPGDYFTTILDSNGCTDTSNVINVVINPLPIPALINDTMICITQTILLDAGAGFSTYYWQDGSPSQTYLASSSISDTIVYTVNVTDSNGCMASDSVSIAFDICAGFEDARMEFIVFPNPAQNQITIAQTGFFLPDRFFSLFDMLGRKMIEVPLINPTHSIDISYLPSGVYHFLITAPQAQPKSGKFVIE